MSPAGTTPSSSLSSWKPARVRVKTRKRVHINGIATSRKVARVEGRGRPSLKSISNSEEENSSFGVDEGTGVPSPKSSSPATKPQQPLTDEEDDVDITRLPNYITIDEISENLKLASLKLVDPIEDEKRYLGMQCNCDFNNCTCLKAYYEYLDYDSDYVFTL